MKQDTKPYDTAFKDLAEQAPELLLRLVGAFPPGATVRLLPREVSAPARVPDQPYEVIGPDAHFIANVEAQTRYDGAMAGRYVDSSVPLWNTHRLPIRNYVLVLTPRGMPAEPVTTLTIEAGDLRLTVSFQIVRLWELSAVEALALGEALLLPFVPLMAGGKAELEQGAQALLALPDEPQRMRLALHFVMLSGLRYTLAEIYEVLRRIEAMISLESLEESSFYQMILGKGEDRGRHSECAKLLRQFAAQRFPGCQLGPEVERVRDLAALEQLLFDLPQLPDVAALRARLTALAAQAA